MVETQDLGSLDQHDLAGTDLQVVRILPRPCRHLDLAARLTTAQIRRLEAEKLLLETRIEIQRARTEPAAPAEAGIARKEEH